MIRFVNVAKEYRINRLKNTLALKNINVHIKKGDFLSIIGPSGSGKSTFLALAGLLDRQTAGEIFINNKEISLLKDRERTNLRYDLCGYVFQFSSLLPALSILDNVMLPLLLRGEKSEKIRAKSEYLLSQVGLTEQQVSQLPYQLSGGEQRRAAVARALLKEPQLLFADEPTSALDDNTAKDLLKLFHQLHLNGTTIIMVTHNIELAKEGTGLMEIRDGRLLNV